MNQAQIRPMAFGGSWYPALRDNCQREMDLFEEENPPPQGHTARYGVVPHAGWFYSGRVAGRVFQHLWENPELDLVVVLGGHLATADPVVAMTEGAWNTPFGPMAIHSGFRPALEKTCAGSLYLETPARYQKDNSTELQLPFAKRRYPQAELLPLRLPPSALATATAQALADYLENSGLRYVVVASTDLTHYGPNYQFTPKGSGLAALTWAREENDRAFIQALERGTPQDLLDTARARHNACSAGAAAACHWMAHQQGLAFHLLDHTSSADVAGEDAANFVGYLGGIYR
ncbi:MAG: AmmeMemoRadiSam system protein B [Deltaproteobacteria bacterium]|nr:AmmeMemoRadiSam system protein B [Deltaproteobacteria bacterium]